MQLTYYTFFVNFYHVYFNIYFKISKQEVKPESCGKISLKFKVKTPYGVFYLPEDIKQEIVDIKQELVNVTIKRNQVLKTR